MDGARLVDAAPEQLAQRFDQGREFELGVQFVGGDGAHGKPGAMSSLAGGARRPMIDA
jgi:hypothetical protein